MYMSRKTPVKQCETVNRLYRKITHKTPPHSTLTTRQCLLQSLDWPLSILMPGKCSLRAGTSVLVYCGPSQGCVVSTESLWRFRWGRDQCIFMCRVFSIHPANRLSMAPSRHTPGPPLLPLPVRASLLCAVTGLKKCLEYISHSY